MFFFFSSRRRHTRYIGDWSSDVCSSDLLAIFLGVVEHEEQRAVGSILLSDGALLLVFNNAEEDREDLSLALSKRSEERRVGKKRRCQVLAKAQDSREE